jgi:predicted nucleic acid-binding protein
MKDRVLIDTSVWIPYLQGTAPGELERAVDELLTGRDVIVPKIVLAELIQGARSEKDIAAILEFLEAFTVVDEGEKTWLDAGRLSYNMKKKGKTINLADCYLAILARENKASILTLDKHFKDLHKDAGLDLIDIE